VSGTQRSGAALGVERGREEASEGQQESAAHGRRRLWDHRPSRRDAPSRAERAGLTHTGTYVDAERAHRGVGRNGSGGGGRPEERHGGPAVHGRAFVGRACLWAAAVERAGALVPIPALLLRRSDHAADRGAIRAGHHAAEGRVPHLCTRTTWPPLVGCPKLVGPTPPR
jgi:hypothetical protein